MIFTKISNSKIWHIFGVGIILISFIFGQFFYALNLYAATFVEIFEDTVYKDAANTTADWEWDTSSAHLINGDWRKADNTDDEGSYEIIQTAVIGHYNVISGPDNKAIVIYTSNNILYSIKWNDAGESVCGEGITACWTNIEGTDIYPDTLGTISALKLSVIKKSDGYPAVAIIANETPKKLYYAQYSPGVGWTASDGQTQSFEMISDAAAITEYKSFSFKADQYGEPSIVWYEKTGTSPIITTIKYTRLDNGVWKHADRTTSGKETIVVRSGTGYTDFNPDFDYVGSNIYFAAQIMNISYSSYAWKWDGANWENLDGTHFASVPGGLADITLLQATCARPSIAINSSNIPYVACTTGTSSIKIAQRLDGAWKYPDGITGGVLSLANFTYNILIDIGIDRDDNLMLWEVSYPTTTTEAEIYFTQWKSGAWKKSDGVTTGWEAASNVTNGQLLNAYYTNDTSTFDRPYTVDENGYPIFLFVNSTGTPSPYPGYVSRYTGNDIKGADKTSNDQDTVFPDSNSQIWYPVIFFDSETKNILVLGQNISQTLPFSMFNNNVYDNTNQDLVSSTIATAHNNSTITSAKLTVSETEPSNTAITYYLSADAGSHWEAVTPGVSHDFTNTGTDLRWKANLTSNSQAATPSLDYLYIDVDGKTAETSGDITISATVDPEMSFNLSAQTCDLESFSSTAIKTCNYSITVNTNATGGYVAYLRSVDGFKSGSNELTPVSDGFVTVGSQEYGVATSDADYASLQINKQVTDCTALDDTTSPVNATSLTASDQSFAKEVLAVADEEITVCHIASISGSTPAGVYSQIVVITLVSNY
ncbi:MAG: hypothetical protein NTZ49_03355 [Candidatus Parcubacteria bacterium]|nr:hypothetical protein [Candidatus Parcubacteria bacterium]